MSNITAAVNALLAEKEEIEMRLAEVQPLIDRLKHLDALIEMTREFEVPAKVSTSLTAQNIALVADPTVEPEPQVQRMPDLGLPNPTTIPKQTGRHGRSTPKFSAKTAKMVLSVLMEETMSGTLRTWTNGEVESATGLSKARISRILQWLYGHGRITREQQGKRIGWTALRRDEWTRLLDQRAEESSLRRKEH